MLESLWDNTASKSISNMYTLPGKSKVFAQFVDDNSILSKSFYHQQRIEHLQLGGKYGSVPRLIS